MRRALAVGQKVAAIGLVAAQLGILGSTQVHVYGSARTLNAGVVVGPEFASVGYETRGPDGAGWFVDLGSWQWAQGQR